MPSLQASTSAVTVAQERQPHVEDNQNGQNSNEQQEEEHTVRTHVSPGQSTPLPTAPQQTPSGRQGQLNDPQRRQEDNTQPQLSATTTTHMQKQTTPAQPDAQQPQEPSQGTPHGFKLPNDEYQQAGCLLYTSDAADE